MAKKTKKLIVFYDEKCVVCSKEIHHYQKQTGSENIDFIDITAPLFDAEKHGVDPYKVHKIMHVKDSEGVIHTKVEAFRQIWKVLPKYNWLYKASKNSFVSPVLDLGYEIFSVARPYLPRKDSSDCKESPYCEIHQENKSLQ